MSDKGEKFLTRIFGTALATFLSRILGLLRVMLESRVFGGGAIASAWGFAFTIPNLFRRIFGEGVLGTALIPIFIQLEAEDGEKIARKKLGMVFAVLGIILAIIVILVSLISIFLEGMCESEHFKLGFKLLPLLMPYAFFICLVGVAQSILNCRKVFILPAYGALILNIVLISTMSVFCYIKKDFNFVLNTMSIMVLVSGVIHLVMMLILMAYYRVLPDLKFKGVEKKSLFMSLYKTTLPGLIGASVFQISMLLDRFFAMFVGAEALPSLNYTERIVYLPIGIVALSFGSVLQVNMAKSVVAKAEDEVVEDLIFGLRHILFLCVPLTFFVMFFRHDIIVALFYGGNFNLDNVQATAMAMLFYSMGICFFCSLKLITPLFYSRKDMKTPMNCAIIVLILNVILNVILMYPMKQGGLALATVIASVANNFLQLGIYHKKIHPIPFGRIFKPLGKAIFATLIGLNIYWISREINLLDYSPSLRFAVLLIESASFGVIYLGVSFLIKNSEAKELVNLCFKRFKR